jgi:putative ABC transport system permease protein
LKPDVTIEQARAEMGGIALALAEERPVTNEKSSVGLALMHDWDVSDTRSALYVFMGAVGLVLLIACANVANLLFARGATRTRECALRAALGAGRSRLIRQLMTESLLLSLIGGTTGLILAAMCNRLVVALNPGGIPRLDEVRLDGRIVAFNIAVTLATAIVFGLLPAITNSRIDLVQSLNSRGQRTGQGIGTARTRDVLVVSEIALALVLVIGAGLMIKSFARLTQVNPGFDSAHLLTLKTNLPDATYNSSSKQWAFYQQVLDRLDALPGVVSAAAVSVPPPNGSTYISDFSIQGRSPDDYGKEVLHNVVTPNYFETMGIPVISGRAFSDTDTGRGSLVVIISDALARRHFDGRDPIGQHMKFSRPEVDRTWYTIVGVVKDVKQEGLGLEPRPEVYEPFSQMANNYMNFMVRTSGDPHSMIPAVLAQIKAVDKDLPPYNIYTMNEVLGGSVRKQRFMTMLLAVFGSVALLLAAIGVYGLTSYSTAQRTGEMGIRMALGASQMDVVALVIRDGLKLVAVGLVVGLAGAFALTRLMAGLLYGVSSSDPLTFILISGLLAGVAALACYIPARRATRVDPMIAVRYE